MDSRILRLCGSFLPLGLPTRIMGILNVTPDSFYSGSAFPAEEPAVEHALKLVREGADLIDIGGESTRPGSRPVPEAEEVSRVLPVIRSLKRSTEVPLSIDTTKSGVARLAVEAGASVLNDISGLGMDPGLAAVAAESGAALILGHTREVPERMHLVAPSEDILREVREGLQGSIDRALRSGVKSDQIVLDPGIGFGKGMEENLLLLSRLEEIANLGFPVMVGVSRKRFIGQVLGLDSPEDRLAGSLAAALVAVFHGALLLRVHDVGATRQATRMADAIRQAGCPA